MSLTGPTWIPPVACPCGEPHSLGARYYVSVKEHEGGRYVLALGPFLTHPEALARVELVRRYVEDCYNPQGRATWYLFGTAAMRAPDAVPGKLNEELRRWQNLRDYLAWRREAEEPPRPRPRRRARKATA